MRVENADSARLRAASQEIGAPDPLVGLAIARDILAAENRGLRLQVDAQRRRVPDLAPAAHQLLGLKLGTVRVLNALARRHPGLARNVERTLKQTWWAVTRQRRVASETLLTLPPDTLTPLAERTAPDLEAARNAPRGRAETPIGMGVPVTIEAHCEGSPLVSVVITCFNYGAHVGEAVASVLAQTFTDLEVIVVDGGSTDGVTPQVVRALEGDRVRTFFRDEPHRVGSNRNFGIEHVSGKYVCCLDADDMLAPTYIEKAAYLLECHNYDVVSSSVQLFGDNHGRYHVAETVDLEVLLRGNEMATCAVFRRSFWAATGGYRDHGDGTAETHVHEDWEFWIRLAAAGARFFNIQRDHLFLYRVHGSASLSRRSEVRSKEEHRALIRSANADILTAQAIDRSIALRKSTFLVANPWRNLIRTQTCRSEKSLLVALPWMVLGGAERLLSTVLGHLKHQGWRIALVTTLEPNEADGGTTSWFSTVTPEIFKLPDYLTDQGKWGDFLEYLVASRGISRLLISGSAYTYQRLPRLKKRFPDLKVFDLLFNTVGHTANNRHHAKFIDHHVVENSEVCNWLVRFGEEPNRITTIPSGIDIPPAGQLHQGHHVRAALGIGRTDFVVGFSGRWSEEKNPIGFIEIAKHLAANPRIHFIMTGMGQMSKAIARRVTDYPNFAGRFHLLVNVPTVSSVIASYDVLVLPSTLDGRPMVVLEALAVGVPVMASGVGGLPELIIPGKNGDLFDPDDLQGFAHKIAALETNRSMLAGYKSAARSFAETHLDARLMLSRFEAVLRMN